MIILINLQGFLLHALNLFTNILLDGYQLKDELLCVTKLLCVALPGFQHLDLVLFRQNLHQAAEFLRLEVVEVPAGDHVDDILVGAAELPQEDVDVQAALSVQ